MGFKKLWDPDKVVLIYDHLVPASQVDDTRHFHVGNAFAEKYGMKGNYVAGANIAGFEKVVNAMNAQGIC